MGETYKQISQAKNDAARVKLLAGIFKHADEKTLRAAAHFSLAKLVEPVMSDRQSIGPATIRDQIATLAKKIRARSKTKPTPWPGRRDCTTILTNAPLCPGPRSTRVHRKQKSGKALKLCRLIDKVAALLAGVDLYLHETALCTGVDHPNGRPRFRNDNPGGPGFGEPVVVEIVKLRYAWQ